MASVEENTAHLQKMAKDAGLSEDDLHEVCKYIVAERAKVGGSNYLEALKEHAEASRDPRERLKENLGFGKMNT